METQSHNNCDRGWGLFGNSKITKTPLPRVDADSMFPQVLPVLVHPHQHHRGLCLSYNSRPVSTERDREIGTLKNTSRLQVGSMCSHMPAHPERFQKAPPPGPLLLVLLLVLVTFSADVVDDGSTAPSVTAGLSFAPSIAPRKSRVYWLACA